MKQIITIGYLNKALWGGQPRTDNSGDSALRGEFTWKGKHLDPWSGFQWNTSPAFSKPSLKDLSITLRCYDTTCIMEVVKYEKSEAEIGRASCRERV